MTRTLVGLGMVGCLALIASGAAWYFSRSGAKHESHGVSRGFCSDCGKRVWNENAPCPFCGTKAGPKTSARTDESPQEAAMATSAKVTISLGIVVVLLIGLNVQHLRRLLTRRANTGEFLVIRCENCGRRLRYLAASAGGNGICPKCGTPVEFPTADVVAHESVEG